jgi:hypothetical protein
VGLLIALLALLLLAVVIVVISGPLRAAAERGSVAEAGRPPISDTTPERSELQAAREAKYREIRDAELDYRTGKLSSEDYAAVDGALRAEALAILNRLQALEGGESTGPGSGSGDRPAAEPPSPADA